MTQMQADALSREELRQLQLERLQMTLNRAYFNVIFIGSAWIGSDYCRDLGTSENLRRFPFTTAATWPNTIPTALRRCRCAMWCD